MVITLHRKGHLEETYPLHFTKSKSGPRFTYRPSLGIHLNRVFLIAPCATRQNLVVGLCAGLWERTQGAIKRSHSTMLIDIKHKHASHVIIIEGHAFKANDHGQWDLTDIWRTLKEVREDVSSRQPKRWSQTKEAARFFGGGKSGSQRVGREEHTFATKQATIRYAAYVSPAFEDMVYDAFEAILEMPEVASLVADKMASLGNDHSADILKRMTFNDKCDWKALKALRKNTQKGLRAAVANGNLTPQRAAELGLRPLKR